MFDRSRKGETALLIQPHAGGPPDEGAVEEFAELARSAGATVAALLNARIDKPNPAILIGKGKLEEVKAACDATGADLVLVNHALSPVQERNLEKLLERRVVDRTGLILDIFAQRARSHEGKLQVELAQLRHMATRLVRGWTHLERQRSAIGMRGPGETQLETDRRLLQKRVDQLQKRLEKVEVQRTQMRRARLRSELPRVALVGYTNAGKSTLFNALTGADAYAADQLFATLDPTVRKIALPGGNSVLADTVGFVRDLPHELVAAFRSTLSEAREADLLLHVIDAADPLREERIAQVDAVLVEIGAGDIPQMLIYNKIDRVMVRADAAADVGIGESGHGAAHADGAGAAGHAATPAAEAAPLAEPVTTTRARRAEAAMPVGADADAFERVAAAAASDGVDGTVVAGNDGNALDVEAADGDAARAATPDDAAAMPGPAIEALQVAMAPRHDRPGGTQPDSIARERVWVSALSGSGMDLLRSALAVRLGLRRIVAQLQLPGSAGRLRARLHEADAVRDEMHDESGWSLGIDIALADAVRLAALPDGGPLRALLPRGEVDHT